MRIVAVIQARSASTRLPGKVLLPLNGKPLLERLIERVRAATEIDDLIVATTTNREDEPIRRLCASIGAQFMSGSAHDLLDRHYRAAVASLADAVVKIPSDCPLIDPAIIDQVVACFRQNAMELDFVSNLHPATHPDGNDVEVVPTPVLGVAWREATLNFEREHTTPFIWDQPERFRIGNVTWERGLDLSMSHRFTIDYAEDYRFISEVYRQLHVDGDRPFTLDDILQLLDARPDILRINTHLAGVNWYRGHLGQLRTIAPAQTVVA